MSKLILTCVILMSVSCTRYQLLPDSYFSDKVEGHREVLRVKLSNGEKIRVKHFSISDDTLIILPSLDYFDLPASKYFCDDTQDIRVPLDDVHTIESNEVELKWTPVILYCFTFLLVKVAPTWGPP